MTKKKKRKKKKGKLDHKTVIQKKSIDEWLTTVIVIHTDQAF